MWMSSGSSLLMLHVAPVFQEYDAVRTIPLHSDTLNSQSSDEHSANGEMYLYGTLVVRWGA